MKPSRRNLAVAGYLLILLALNAYVARDLFIAEYTGHMNSMQGLWISMARLAGEHWFQPAWWPFQDGGMPFEHTYMPLVPGSTALYAKLAHVSAARAFNTITGIVYCLGPLTLFLMALGMTRAPGYSFWAVLAYSLTSPARALIRDPNIDLSLLWTSRRLYTMAVWDDVPHGAALCFLPLVILFLWLSLTKRRMRYYILAGVFVVLAVLASVFGAVAILLSIVCLLWVLKRERLSANLLLIAVIGGLAYLVVCPFLPPSLIATIRTNQQMFAEDQWSMHSFTALSIVALGWAVVWSLLQCWTKDQALRFFVMFAFLTSSIPLLDAYGNRHFLPQAGRYQPEMEIGLALAIVFGLCVVSQKLPRNIKVALSFFLLCMAGEQLISHRRYARQIIWPNDVTGRIEYRVAKWVDQNMPGQRVMVPGSIAQWFNVFSDTPQLSGASYSTTPNWMQQNAMVSIMTGVGPQEAATSLLWLKAFGVQAVTVSGPKSTEFWKPYTDPKKFAGLPVLWSENDTTIYRVPQRNSSLAHVMPAGALPQQATAQTLPVDQLKKYVAALDDPAMPTADLRWETFRRLRIRTTAQRDQVISVQTSYHPGWHARANGHDANVGRDGLGFIVIQPQCAGYCEIEMTYDGGWEYRICRLLSLFTLAGLLGWFLLRYVREHAARAK